MTDQLIKKLSCLAAGDLGRVSYDAGVESRRWSEGGRLTDEAARLVDAVKSGKQLALRQAVLVELAP